MREAQCFDALASMRSALRAKTHLIKHKNANVRGQRRTTRALGVIDRYDARANVVVAKYWDGRKALLALRGPGEWETTLLELKDGDIRAPGAHEFTIEESGSTIGPDGRVLPRRHLEALERGLGEGRRLVSWIWMSGVTTGPNEDIELNSGT